MADVTLAGASPDLLVRLGDEAARAGNFGVAKRFYEAAWRETATVPIAARLGAMIWPNAGTPKLLDALQSLEQVGKNAFIGEGLATWGKIVPGLADQRFRETAARYAKLHPMPNWHWNLGVVAWAVQQARRLEGDLVELGVFRGHTTAFVADLVDFGSWPKRWLLYDTFNGIPDDQIDPGWETSNALAYRNIEIVGEVRDRFAAYPNIEVIQGRVPEILDERAPEKIAFAHIDLNNATAEVAALDRLYDRIEPGGVIVFDDYCWAVSSAQHHAVKSWFEMRDLPLLGLPTGQGLFVKSP